MKLGMNIFQLKVTPPRYLVIVYYHISNTDMATNHMNSWGGSETGVNVRFEVLMVANMKMTVFWVVAPCSLVEVY
jgi:hypothetical protein